MSQLTAKPQTCPVCESDDLIPWHEPSGGYPVDHLLPVVVCQRCSFSARFVFPEDASDPLDIDELRARAALARDAHPEWSPTQLAERVYWGGWDGETAR